MEAAPAPDEQQRADAAAPALRGVVYTAVSLGYDRRPLAGYEEPGVEKMVNLLTGADARERTIRNREWKILGVPTAGLWSVYVDGSISPKGPIRELVEGWLDRADMALFKHPHRSCAYAEIDACVARNKITPEEGEKARSHLLLSGFPRDFGLWACGMIARRTHANALQQFVAPYWFTLVQDVPRDQIWLPFVLWRLKHATKRIHTIDGDIFDNPWFSFRRHGT